MRMPVLVGLLSILFLAGAVGLWGAQAQIAGAVLGKGTVEVSEVSTAVQHPIGGVVARIEARTGDRVEAGDVVIRLDDLQLRSELVVTEGQLYETMANQARLEAMVDDAPDMVLPVLLQEAAAKYPNIATLLARKKRELDAHYTALENSDRLLARQIDQVSEQIAGINAQLEAKIAHQALLSKELADSDTLAAKGLLKRSVVFDQQKDALNTRGEVGRLRARAAELQGKILELELKRLTLAPDLKTKASDELSKLRPDRIKFLEKRLALLNDLSQLDIRAPVSGTIHDSKVEGLRSVVVKAKTLMSIVPSDIPIAVKVLIDATDIDQVFIGQETALRFSAFSRRNTPVIFGDVGQISADAFLDPKTRKPYYEVHVILRIGELDKLEGKALIPGMPAEAFISTSSRTPLNYVTKPLKDYFDRAFRDA